MKIKLQSARYFWLLVLMFLSSTSLNSIAAIDIYQFEDQEQEQRFKVLSDELRCPKCQNTNLSGSDAPLAKDLRNQIYTLLKDGRSNSDIVDYMILRYGDFVLYRPRLTGSTFTLWFGPVILLMLGVIVLIVLVRKRQAQQTVDQSLTEEEKQRLNNILNSESKS